MNALGVAYGVVGGYALIAHGVRRFTEDVDILVDGEDIQCRPTEPESTDFGDDMEPLEK